MTGRRKRQTRGGHTSPGAPSVLPKPPVGPAPGARDGEPPAAGPELSPPAAGGASTVTAGRVAELVAAATQPGATAEDVARARAELARVLATALDLALDQADLDQVIKLTDRLAKLLPAAPGQTPDAPAGGDHGNADAGEPTPAERLRLLSAPMGD